MLVAFYYGYKNIDEIRYLFSEYQNIKSKVVNCNGVNLILFGYGADFNSVSKDKYSLYDSGLDSRNLVIKIEASRVIIESDWLGSVPVFYSYHSGEASTHWALLEERNQKPDWIGRYILKKYSYIPNQRTILENVKRLLSYEKLIISKGKINLMEAPVDDIEILQTKPNEVLSLISQSLKSSEVQKFMVPLSSGYDSRLLLVIANNVRESENIETTTYTLSEGEDDCFESSVARQISKKLNIKWSKFYLKGYSKKESTIYNRVGGVTHINGDYYDYFAEQYLNSKAGGDNLVVVSGIVGDAWAGKIRIPKDKKIIRWSDIIYSHGIKIYNIFINKKEIKEKFNAENELDIFYKNRNLSTENFLIELIRAKITVINFLCYSFEARGVKVKSPFLDKIIVQKILGLPEQEKKHRVWQEKYFSNFKVANKELIIKKIKVNYLAIDEGRNKFLNKSGYDKFLLEQSLTGKLVYKIINSRIYRNIESHVQKNKLIEYSIRRLGYIRTDVMISILKVIYK